MTDATPAFDQVWASYMRAIDDARQTALAWRWAQTPEMRSQAMYFISMMQAFGFNTYMAPRTAYPTFFSHLMFTPVEYNWGAPSPDFRYHWTRIDGSRDYRIWGKRGNTPWLHIQAQKGWWGDPDQTNVGQWDVDDFALDADGSFEIIASPDEHPGNWMKLPRDVPNICLLVRDIWDQWEGTDGATIYLEPLDTRQTGSDRRGDRGAAARDRVPNAVLARDLDADDRRGACRGRQQQVLDVSGGHQPHRRQSAGWIREDALRPRCG
jgi:hypothetical protein